MRLIACCASLWTSGRIDHIFGVTTCQVLPSYRVAKYLAPSYTLGGPRVVADIVASVPESQSRLVFTWSFLRNVHKMDELVMSFMETDAPHMHSAFAEQAVYDKQRGVYRKREPIE